MKDFLKRWLSRKLILSLVAGIVAFGNSYWDWGLTNEQVMLVLVPLLAFVGFEGVADIKNRK